MAQRFSLLSNRIEEVPDAPAKSEPQDLSGQVSDLRVQLATAQAHLDAARGECSTLTDRLAKAEAELTALRNRPAPKPTLIQPAAQPPSTYEVTVVRRDADGRLAELQLTPTAAKPPKW